MNRLRHIVAIVILSGALAGCGGNSNQQAATDKNNLAAMQKATITIKGHAFEVWLAKTGDEQQKGLMQVTQDQLAPLPNGAERGMLFVFPTEQPLSFWMFNTIIPLDIIYIRGDGQIVRKYTMAPNETRIYPSVEPALYALEVREGLFNTLGIGPGDHVEIPDSVLKPTP